MLDLQEYQDDLNSLNFEELIQEYNILLNIDGSEKDIDILHKLFIFKGRIEEELKDYSKDYTDFETEEEYSSNTNYSDLEDNENEESEEYIENPRFKLEEILDNISKMYNFLQNELENNTVQEESGQDSNDIKNNEIGESKKMAEKKEVIKKKKDIKKNTEEKTELEYKNLTLEDMVNYIKKHYKEHSYETAEKALAEFKENAFIEIKNAKVNIETGKTKDTKYSHYKARKWFVEKYVPTLKPKKKEPKKNASAIFDTIE